MSFNCLCPSVGQVKFRLTIRLQQVHELYIINMPPYFANITTHTSASEYVTGSPFSGLHCSLLPFDFVLLSEEYMKLGSKVGKQFPAFRCHMTKYIIHDFPKLIAFLSVTDACVSMHIARIDP